ncbi:MAG TPA: hypothetical protein VFV38_14480 [Ktedonobacteraceae bacterium]|nr:hypothetical protein [Ktedonobacteraceae bacterium]
MNKLLYTAAAFWMRTWRYKRYLILLFLSLMCWVAPLLIREGISVFHIGQWSTALLAAGDPIGGGGGTPGGF